MSGLERKCSELSLVSCSDAGSLASTAARSSDDQVLGIDDRPLTPLAKKVNAKFRHPVFCRNAMVRVCDFLSTHPERALQVWAECE